MTLAEDLNTEANVVRNRRFWIPVIVSIPVTVICVVSSLLTADFGFATYDAMMVLFPFTMLSVVWFGVITPVIGIASLFQWPLYGVIIGRSWVRGKVVVVVEVLLLVHLVAAVAAIKFIKYPDRQPLMIIKTVPTKSP